MSETPKAEAPGCAYCMGCPDDLCPAKTLPKLEAIYRVDMAALNALVQVEKQERERADRLERELTAAKELAIRRGEIQVSIQWRLNDALAQIEALKGDERHD